MSLCGSVRVLSTNFRRASVFEFFFVVVGVVGGAGEEEAVSVLALLLVAVAVLHVLFGGLFDDLVLFDFVGLALHVLLQRDEVVPRVHDHVLALVRHLLRLVLLDAAQNRLVAHVARRGHLVLEIAAAPREVVATPARGHRRRRCLPRRFLHRALALLLSLRLDIYTAS